MAFKCDASLYNVFILGISFMFLFSAFNGTQLSVPSVVYSVKAESGGSFTGDGYTSLCIIYAVAFFCHFLGPPVVACIGPKLSMFFCGMLYCVFIVSFLKPTVWVMYLCSALVGLAAPILWNANQTLLADSSDLHTIGRNVGIMVAVFNVSGIVGNVYSSYVLGGSAIITPGERSQLFIGFTVTGLLGVFCLLLLRKPTRSISKDVEDSIPVMMDAIPESSSLSIQASERTPLNSLKRCFQLMKTKEVMLLSSLAFYQGFEISFGGVYATCLGNNRLFGNDSKGLIGASGISSSIGLILGAVVFSWYGKHAVRYGRDPVVLIGYLLQTLTYYVIFLTQQATCPTQESSGPTYIPSNKYIAVLCSFTFGLGGSCFQTQLISMVAYLYHDNSSPAFAAVFMFTGMAASSAFFYSKYLELHWHLIILFTTSTVGLLCFCLVEWGCMKAVRQGYQHVQTEEEIDMDEMHLD